MKNLNIITKVKMQNYKLKLTVYNDAPMPAET